MPVGECRDYYALRKASGQCAWCTMMAAPGKTKCQGCSDKGKQRIVARKLAGICVRCPEPAVPGRTLCLDCNTKHTDKHREIKRIVMAAYGGRCACCGEEEVAFLSIDHMHGGGRKHREEIGAVGSRGFYGWLKDNNYPAGFQVLCHNCNMGRHLNGGICPHKQ